MQKELSINQDCKINEVNSIAKSSPSYRAEIKYIYLQNNSISQMAN